ncbi:MAG: UDP-N-acetylmuramoyl-tripeptide--D-alanyl-D-alanine ligase [Pseudomonadota bacterium]|nr:UDP-N-acetylmuramoyl-tripeptide--D-alanyl-D-alanine ligase [Pseudomonadota bacterium]
MMVMPLSEAAQVLDAKQWGADVTFRGISTDTRTLSEGNLFVALQGPNFDGHDYLEQARRQGAVAAAVSRVSNEQMPLLEVKDTRIALGELAAHWRSQFAIPLIAVTGSNGKTSVKEMLASILRRCGETLVTQGNLNNDIGVPLTLFRLSSKHEYAVLELGANHPGEIACLTDLARPSVGVVNNAGPAHLEGFGDVSDVAKAKGELFEGLAPDAVCVINADDAFADLWNSMASPRRIISFGLSAAAEVAARWTGDISGSDVELMTPAGTASLRLALPGQHNVMNALAATAGALALNITLEDIVCGLADVRPLGGRWQSQPGINGAQLINDTYNANPASLQVALDLLCKADAETWLVLGDMGELGEEGKELHRKVGEEARQAGVEHLFALGDLAAEAADAFGKGSERFTDLDSLNMRLKKLVHPGVIVLVKGSRAMRMERVVQALRPDQGGA